MRPLILISQNKPMGKGKNRKITYSHIHVSSPKNGWPSGLISLLISQELALNFRPLADGQALEWNLNPTMDVHRLAADYFVAPSNFL